MKPLRCGLLLCGLAGVLGCATPTVNTRKVDITQVPPALQAGYRALATEGPRNFVLNQMELGVDALQLGELDIGAQALDACRFQIDSIYGNDRGARRAKSAFHAESNKRFKGEPYERVMVYYYRGIAYLLTGDIENARACFRGGMVHDAFVEEAQHRNDFAALLYLDAWCSWRLNDPTAAEEAVERLRKLRPKATLPNPNHNVLIIAETGFAPRKLAIGPGQSELVFRRGLASASKHVRLRNGTHRQVIQPMEDLYWQASTRGGRPIDRILEGKVRFKKRWDSAGTTLTGLGLTGLHIAEHVDKQDRREARAIAGGTLALGALAQLFASAVKPEADNRYWRNLPDTLHVSSMHLPVGSHKLELQFLSRKRQPSKTEERQLDIQDPKQPQIVWARAPENLVSGSKRYLN